MMQQIKSLETSKKHRANHPKPDDSKALHPLCGGLGVCGGPRGAKGAELRLVEPRGGEGVRALTVN